MPTPPGAGAGSAAAGADSYQRISDDLLAIVTEAAGSTDLVVPQLLGTIATGLGFEVAAMWRWRPGPAVLICDRTWQAPGVDLDRFVQATLASSIRPGEPVPGVVLATGEPVWLADLPSHPNFRRAGAAADVGLRSGFAFPVRRQDRVVGVIELYSLEERRSDGPLFDAVARVGARLGEFLERLELEARQAELIAELEESRRRQEFLLQANRALVGARSLQETIDRLARVAVPTLGDLCLIDVVTPDGSLERLAAQHADRARQPLADELVLYPPRAGGDHPAARAVRTGGSLVQSEMPTAFMQGTTMSPRHLEITRRLGFTSYITVPMLVSGHTLGAITIVSSGSGRRFTAKDLSLVEDLAAQVGAVLDRAQSYDEQRQISHALQRSLLPERLETTDGIHIAARYQASNDATEVGGDFYDVVSVDAGPLAVAIGDVEGHDMTATTVMGRVHSALRAYLDIEDRPDEVLHLLDRYVERHAEGRLVTVCLALLWPATGSLLIISAGHPPPILVEAGGSCGPLTVAPGPPLGWGPGERAAQSFTLPPGASLVLYTDGLIEDRRSGPEARLATLCRALAHAGTADATPDELCDAALGILADAGTADDVALLVVQRAPA